MCDLHLGWNHIAISYKPLRTGPVRETITINGKGTTNKNANIYNYYCRGISSKLTTPNCLIADCKIKSIYESPEVCKLESERLLIHYPFNNLVLPCIFRNAKPGIQCSDYTSTLTKDSSI